MVSGIERNLTESSVYLEKALKIDPSGVAIRRNLASNQWQMGHFAEARTNLKRVLAANPRDARSIVLRGMVEESLKNYAEAAHWLESVPELVREQPESLTALARAYYHTGQTEEARHALDQLVRHASGDRGLFLAGQTAAGAGDYQTAEALFRSVKSGYPDAATLAYQIASVQYRAGHLDQCQSTLNGIISSGHLSVDIYDLLALCYYKQGKSTEAMKVVNESLERIPHTESDHVKLGNMLLANRSFAAGHEAAKRAVALAPASERAYALKGTAELDLNFYKDAIESFSKALQLDPSSPEPQLGLAMAEWGAGNTSQAALNFQKGIKRFPRESRLYTKYARMLLELGEQTGDSGQQSRAVALLERAIGVNGSDADAHYELGNLALSKGNPKQAVQELETAVKLDPENSSTRYALSRAYRRVGRNEDASKEMQVYTTLKAGEEASP